MRFARRRGQFLSLREQDFVQAARAVGASNRRIMIPPGLAITLTVLSINFVGDALRDALDTRSTSRR
jgi:ABC-type dipeptide/oligopeptide/nickel transport system permease subunit